MINPSSGTGFEIVGKFISEKINSSLEKKLKDNQNEEDIRCFFDFTKKIINNELLNNLKINHSKPVSFEFNWWAENKNGVNTYFIVIDVVISITEKFKQRVLIEQCPINVDKFKSADFSNEEFKSATIETQCKIIDCVLDILSNSHNEIADAIIKFDGFK